MKKLIALVAVTVCVAYATTYIQTSPTGAAPWKPVKDSVSRAHISDSALAAPASAYADSSRASGLADSAKKSGMAANALSLGGVAAANYGTLTQDTLIAKKVVSDSLTANTRAWTTLAAAKSSIHDSLTVERTFDTVVSRNIVHDSLGANTRGWLTANQSISLTGAVTGSGTTSIATSFSNSHLAGINQDLATTSTATFAGITAGGTNFIINQPIWNNHLCLFTGGVAAIDAVSTDGTAGTTSVTINGALSVTNRLTASILTVNNATHTNSLWVAGDALTFYSPSVTTAFLGVTAHPMTITMADGSLTLPSGLGVNGPFGLPNFISGNLTYSEASHNGCLIRLQPSNTFTLPASAVIGDWCIVYGGAPSQQGATAGKILAPGGMFVRGSATSQTTLQLYGAVIAAYDGFAWYVG